MRNLSRVIAVLTVALSTGCPGPREPDTEPGPADGGETAAAEPVPPAKSETGGAEAGGADAGGAASSTCQDELDRAMAEATAKFDECKAGTN